MADDQSRGVHLSDKQLVFVFMAGTVAAVVFFLFGVLVGRGVQQARGPLADGGMAAATEVVPDGAPGEPPVADGAPRSGSGGLGGDELSVPGAAGQDAACRTAEARAAPTVPAEPLAPSHGPLPRPLRLQPPSRQPLQLRGRSNWRR